MSSALPQKPNEKAEGENPEGLKTSKRNVQPTGNKLSQFKPKDEVQIPKGDPKKQQKRPLIYQEEPAKDSAWHPDQKRLEDKTKRDVQPRVREGFTIPKTQPSVDDENKDVESDRDDRPKSFVGLVKRTPYLNKKGRWDGRTRKPSFLPKQSHQYKPRFGYTLHQQARFQGNFHQQPPFRHGPHQRARFQNYQQPYGGNQNKLQSWSQLRKQTDPSYRRRQLRREAERKERNRGGPSKELIVSIVQTTKQLAATLSNVSRALPPGLGSVAHSAKQSDSGRGSARPRKLCNLQKPGMWQM